MQIKKPTTRFHRELVYVSTELCGCLTFWVLVTSLFTSSVTVYPKQDIREFFSDIWAAVKFDAYPMKFGLRAALGVTDELNLMFS